MRGTLRPVVAFSIYLFHLYLQKHCVLSRVHVQVGLKIPWYPEKPFSRLPLLASGWFLGNINRAHFYNSPKLSFKLKKILLKEARRMKTKLERRLASIKTDLKSLDLKHVRVHTSAFNTLLKQFSKFKYIGIYSININVNVFIRRTKVERTFILNFIVKHNSFHSLWRNALCTQYVP